MGWRTSAGRRWILLRDRLKREFLRDPHRILLDRAPDPSPSQSARVATADNR